MMVSPQLRAMRLRFVRNKHLAYLRDARKEMREAAAETFKIRWYWYDADNDDPDKIKVKYDG